jgi:hypothetical protein
VTRTSKKKAHLPGDGKKRLVFALTPSLAAALLVVVAEIGLRVAGLDTPRMSKPPLPAELAGIHQADDELFWTLRPGFDGTFQGVRVVTNHLGLRAPELGPKEAGEFRILSLGESTTFGAMVGNDETYSAFLEADLNRAFRDTSAQPVRSSGGAHPSPGIQATEDRRAADATGPPGADGSSAAGANGRVTGAGGAPAGAMRFRVLNAGVSAWTSFQSLKYLELRGLALKPDLVLFYHEYNDHLPASIRDFHGDEGGMALTDRQLYESKARWLHRRLSSWSAIYRYFSYRASRRAIVAMQSKDDPALSIQKGVVQSAGGQEQVRLPQRVSPEERKQILEDLLTVCRNNNIRLVVIHPTYSYSKRHECALTEFCVRRGVPMLEAFDSLHPDSPGPSLFLDNVHPTVEGHRRLAADLSRFLIDNQLVVRR